MTFTVRGLKTNVELNNKRGKIIGRISDRYRVVVDNELMALKNENIIIDTNSCVKIVNLKRKDFNNKWGKIIDFDYSTNRYTIDLGSNHLSIKQINVV